MLYSGHDPVSPRQPADNRKIVGVLITYTWTPTGEMFPVKQGRTHIGAGQIRGEDRQVEVVCGPDDQVSADHAMILVQGDNFFLQDLSSSNGTMLNGTTIRPELPEPLPSPAEIRVGQTVFTFVRFEVTATAAVTRPAEQAKTQDPRATIAPR